MTQLSPADALEVERDYVAYRKDVVELLRAAFGDLIDVDEIYNEAWTTLLERRARGERVRGTRGFLRTVAWRRARDRVKRQRPTAMDPTSFAFTTQVDAAPTPDEQAEVHLEAETLRQIIEDLEPRHALVLKLRFDLHLTPAEIQQHLGLSAKRLEKIVTAAYKEVHAHLAQENGETRWHRRQRSLLLACEAGLASPRQLRRAQRMVAADPACRAMLQEMRRALDQLAGLLSYPVIVGAEHERLARVPGALSERLGVMRDWFADIAARTGGHAPSIEQVGAGAASTASAGLAAKLAVVCFVTAGGALTCVETGLFQRHERDRPHKERAAQDSSPPRREPRPVRTTPPPPPTPAKRPKATTASTDNGGSKSANAKPSPLPAPEGSQEFGVGAIGSDAENHTPASAP